MQKLRGQLLVSGGGLFDANFRHTVVLIGDHGEWGAVGVVLHRPLEVSVADAIPSLAELTGFDENLFEGGPVETQHAVLLVEVADAALLDVPVFDGVGGDVSADVRAAVLRARVYLRHAGWGAGQLEAELEAGAWIIEPATCDDVFADDPDSLWRRVLQRKGPPYDTLARVPYDPRTN